ncbi:MAG: putative DNA-binding domain-containing protein [Parvularculaceae bacterium]
MSDRDYFDRFAQILKSREPVKDAPIFIGEPARVEAGLAIYRNNVRSALSKALAAKFPVVEKLVGEGFFKYLAHEYFHAHPPFSQLITLYGDELPAFLETFEPARKLSYLADVARLEIAWLEAYHAADAQPLAPDAITAMIGDDPGGLRFALHPSLRLLASAHPAASIWRHNRTAENPAPATFEGTENIVVARPVRDVVVTTVSSGVIAFIEALSNGDAIDAALAAGMSKEPALDPQSAFQALFAHQIIVGVDA